METLVESSLRAIGLAAGTAIVLRLFRIRAPHVAHHVWVGIATTLLLLPILVAWGPKVRIPILDAAPTVTVSHVSDAARLPEPAKLDISSAGVAAPQPIIWQTAGVVIYIAGVVLFLLRVVLGVRGAQVLRRQARLVDGRLTHQDCVTPITVGLLRPVVILPPDWVHWHEEELAAVLAHEREHVRRRDPLMALLALIARAVYWFHPLAWWLRRRISTLAEQACDAVVLSGGHDRAAYSASLLRFARCASDAGRTPPSLGMAMPGTGLHARLAMIQGPPVAAVSATRLATVTLAYAVILVTGAAAMPAAQGVVSPDGVWRSTATPHFDIFFTEAQRDLVADAGGAAETAYAELGARLQHTVAARVSLILIEGNRDLPAGLMQSRALAERDAPPRDHLVMSRELQAGRPRAIVHELTHHFAFDIIPTASRTTPWLVEGLAEHLRDQWNTRDLQQVRRAVASGQIPAIESLTTTDAPWAHALFDYVAARDGEGVRRFLFALRKTPDPTVALPVALDDGLADINRTFHAFVIERFGER